MKSVRFFSTWSSSLLLLLLLITALPVAATVYYVDGDRPATGGGTAWGDEFKTLQEAVDAAISTDEIWVKKGTYTLAASLVINSKSMEIYGGFDGLEFNRTERDWVANPTIIDGNGSVVSVIVLQNGAAPTIDGFRITGGTAGNSVFGDGGGIHMSHCAGLTPVIRNNNIYDNGNNDYGAGGGIFNWNCNPFIANNIFRLNKAHGGGAIYNEASYAVITNNTITNNYAVEHGGAIENMDVGSPVISNNILWDNLAGIGDPEIFNFPGAAPVVQYNITDQGNHPACLSGSPDVNGNICEDPLLFGFRPHLRVGSPAIDAGLNSAPGLPSIDFENDLRIIDGDKNGSPVVDIGADEFIPGQVFGIWYVDGSVAVAGSGTSWSDPVKSVHEAIGNAQSGEEIWVKEGTYPFSIGMTTDKILGIYGGFSGWETLRSQRDPKLNETVLDGLDSSYILRTSADNLEVDGFTITRSNGVSIGGGRISNCRFINNISAALSVGAGGMVQDCYFEGNSDSALRGSGTVQDSVFVNNTGSAVIPHDLVIERCAFFGNSAGDRGGAVKVGSGALADVRNSLFVGNHAGAANDYEGGGAIWVYNSPIQITNSTFYGNYTENNGMGGAIGSFNNYGGYTAINSIFWNNSAPGQPWSDNFRGTPTVTYSDVDETWSGAGNINADPIFIDPDGADDVPGTVDDDLRLDAGSPAVDTGDNSVFSGCVSDLGRAFRYQDDPAVIDTGDPADTPPYIDMGAYERSGDAPGDILSLNQDISQSEDISACTSVTLGNGLSITGSVTVKVQAGKSIGLRGEFSVEIGSTFSALVAPLP